MDVGEFIKERRIENKQSQLEFGKMFGISHAAVSDIERGITTHIPISMINFLFDFEDKPEASDYINFGYNQALKDIKEFLVKSKKF